MAAVIQRESWCVEADERDLTLKEEEFIRTPSKEKFHELLQAYLRTGRVASDRVLLALDYPTLSSIPKDLHPALPLWEMVVGSPILMGSSPEEFEGKPPNLVRLLLKYVAGWEGYRWQVGRRELNLFATESFSLPGRPKGVPAPYPSPRLGRDVLFRQVFFRGEYGQSLSSDWHRKILEWVEAGSA